MNSRRKGKDGELEFSNVCKTVYGFETRRGQQFAGGPDSADVVGLPHIHCEIKRCQALNMDDALAQAVRDSLGTDNVPVVFHRKDRQVWKATLGLSDFMMMYKAWRAYENIKT